MILVDANLLIYACNKSATQHDEARRWLDGKLTETAIVGLPWPTLLAFVRIATNPRAVEQPLEVSGAWRQVEEWLDSPSVRVPVPTERHREVLGRLIAATRAQGNLVSDAHVAALAIEHGLTLCSTDSDFARFPGLKWENPLSSA